MHSTQHHNTKHFLHNFYRSFLAASPTQILYTCYILKLLPFRSYSYKDSFLHSSSYRHLPEMKILSPFFIISPSSVTPPSYSPLPIETEHFLQCKALLYSRAFFMHPPVTFTTIHKYTVHRMELHQHQYTEWSYSWRKMT